MNSRHFVHKIMLLILFNIQFYYHRKTLEKNEQHEEEKICDWGILSLGVRTQKKQFHNFIFFLKLKRNKHSSHHHLFRFKRSLSVVWGKVLRFSLQPLDYFCKVLLFQLTYSSQWVNFLLLLLCKKIDDGNCEGKYKA